MAEKPSIPKGTRDFTPPEMARRNFIFDTIRSVFTTYGYLPIETPAMENLSSLMGKYGEEGDKLLFKVLNSGDFKNKVSQQDWTVSSPARLGTLLSEKGLRYDLTVPFARFVVQHRNEIAFPFKRYQIQPVWRADRPQRGRYREFYQCDVDVIGSHSLLNELELVQIMDEVFKRLGLKVTIKVNHRKILAGIVEAIGEPAGRLTDITVAIDKLEKVGRAKVIGEMKEKGVSSEALEKLRPIWDLAGSGQEKLQFLQRFLVRSVTGREGLDDLKTLFGYLESVTIDAPVEFDMTLARGLNYYTGVIFEVSSAEMPIGSICGGGRYDDLTGIFGMEGVSGVGVSFGADRIYDVMLKLERFPLEGVHNTRLLFVNFGKKEAAFILPILSQLRHRGIPSELYPDAAKMKKQMSYANSREIPFVALAGEEEIGQGVVTLREMESGNQERLTPPQLIDRLQRG